MYQLDLTTISLVNVFDFGGNGISLWSGHVETTPATE